MAASFGGLVVSLARLLLLCLNPTSLIFQLAPASLQPAGDLRQQVVSVLDARPDVTGTVLKLALALKIESVEQDLGNRFRVFLRHESLG